HAGIGVHAPAFRRWSTMVGAAGSVDPQGDPVLGCKKDPTAPTIVLQRRKAGAWTPIPAWTPEALEEAALVVDATGEPAFVWHQGPAAAIASHFVTRFDGANWVDVWNKPLDPASPEVVSLVVDDTGSLALAEAVTSGG